MSLQTIAGVWTLVAALVAFLGVMITVTLQRRNFAKQLRSAHALKIAEMWQEWSNNLRNAMSAFQSFGVTPDLDHRAARQFYGHGTKIELMMNPNDPNYEALQQCLYVFLGASKRNTKPILGTLPCANAF